MKRQNPICTSKKIFPNLKKHLEENQRLRLQLLEDTEKQHQAMTRAIQLKEKNILLRDRIHEAKTEACRLRNLLNSELRKESFKRRCAAQVDSKF